MDLSKPVQELNQLLKAAAYKIKMLYFEQYTGRMNDETVVFFLSDHKQLIDLNIQEVIGTVTESSGPIEREELDKAVSNFWHNLQTSLPELTLVEKVKRDAEQ